MPSTRQEELRRLARERIDQRELPGEEPAQVWGGQGSGRLCALCGIPIRSDELEYEFEQRLAGRVQTFRFHVTCETLWQLECTQTNPQCPVGTS